MNIINYGGGKAMSDDFGSDFISISDDEGNEYELEHLDTIEVNGKFFLAFLPADVDENSDKFGLLILKQEEDNGENYLVVPDDSELEVVYQKFMERLFSDEDSEDGQDDDGSGK